jgi:hypothetical protein
MSYRGLSQACLICCADHLKRGLMPAVMAQAVVPALRCLLLTLSACGLVCMLHHGYRMIAKSFGTHGRLRPRR